MNTVPLQLQLRLLRSQGVETSVVLPMVVGHKVDLQPVWKAGPMPVPAEQCAAMALCRISHTGADTATGGGVLWWVTPGSAELVCAVNQQRLHQGETLRLNDGDVLELGLMRFAVERCQPALDPQSVPASGAAPAPYAEFELTNLLLLEQTGHPLDTRDSPFSDIADIAYRLDVVAPDAAAAADGADTATDELLDVKAPDLMRRLHARYLRLMRNPHEVEPVDDWNPGLAHTSGKHSELEDLTQRAVGFDGLYDILGHGGTIGTVLEGLDLLSDYELLGAEPGVDVLRLFAPVDLMASDTALPSLTRREHHMLSADSAAHLGQSLLPSSL